MKDRIRRIINRLGVVNVLYAAWWIDISMWSLLGVAVGWLLRRYFYG
jgi:hypothetical protein